MPTSITIIDNFFQDYFPPSPTASTPLVTITPCRKASASASKPQSAPLFTNSTTTTTTTTTPTFNNNVSDTGAEASGFTHVSLLQTDDSDTMFGDDHDNFDIFHYSPFTFQKDSDDDDAPISKGQFKVLNTNLDSLLESSKASSNNDYSQASIKAFLNTLTKQNSVNLALTNKVVVDTEKIYNETTPKVEKLLSDVTTFMGDFKTSFETNTASVNMVLSGLSSTL